MSWKGTPGKPCCVAFVSCFATPFGNDNPTVKRKCKTGGMLDLWNRAQTNGVKKVAHDDAFNDPRNISPGMIFIISTGGGHGHAGFVVRVDGNRLETIEGNTNAGGSPDGIGVFRRKGRTIDSINRGFIDFAGG